MDRGAGWLKLRSRMLWCWGARTQGRVAPLTQFGCTGVKVGKGACRVWGARREGLSGKAGEVSAEGDGCCGVWASSNHLRKLTGVPNWLSSTKVVAAVVAEMQKDENNLDHLG